MSSSPHLNLELFNTNINSILHSTANRSLPTSSPLASLPQLFATHFSDKISKPNFNLQTNPSSTPALSKPTSRPPLIHSSIPVTLLDIDNLRSQSSDSYCDLDSVPPNVLKKMFQRHIANYPINSKSFHNHWYLPFHIKIIYVPPPVKNITE